jgi:large subunit ribosomal protein L24
MKKKTKIPKLKIKKGDTVKMLKGKDRGKTGKVLEVRPKEMKVVVEGLNLVKKHKRFRTQGMKGEIVSLPRAVPIANVMLVCPSCGDPTRVGILRLEGRRFRVCKKCKYQFE